MGHLGQGVLAGFPLSRSKLLLTWDRWDTWDRGFCAPLELGFLSLEEALILFMGFSFGSVLRGGTRGCSYQGIATKGTGWLPQFVVRCEVIRQAEEDSPYYQYSTGYQMYA
jgi:hypothetical protein